MEGGNPRRKEGYSETRNVRMLEENKERVGG